MRKNYFLLFVLLLLFTACTKKLSPKEAETHLKAFDSEMINLAKQVSGTHGFKALEQLVAIKNKPIPYQLNNQAGAVNESIFDFNKKKGVYYYDESKNELFRQSHSDSIVIIFPYRSDTDSIAKLVIAQYAESMSVWGVMLPTSVDLFLEIGGRKLLIVKSKGSMEYQVPVKFDGEVWFENFSFIFKLNTRLSKNMSTINAGLEVNKDSKPLLSLQSKMKVSINDQQQFIFNQIDFKGEVFPIKVDGIVKYGKISPTTTFFVNDFNKHSDIRVFSGQNSRVGHIELRERKMNDRLGFAVVYTDHSFAFLDDLLLSFREIMNTKL